MFIESLSPDEKVTLPAGLFLAAKEFGGGGGGRGVPIKHHGHEVHLQ